MEEIKSEMQNAQKNVVDLQIAASCLTSLQRASIDVIGTSLEESECMVLLKMLEFLGYIITPVRY